MSPELVTLLAAARYVAECQTEFELAKVNARKAALSILKAETFDSIPDGIRPEVSRAASHLLEACR